jgi:hypothetical protein
MRWKLIIKIKTSEISTEAKTNLRKGKTRINIKKDENGNLIADPQNVLNRWKHFFKCTWGS